MAEHKVSIELDGKTYSLETGKMARFANGSVMVRAGDSMVLVTAVASKDPIPDAGFLPLQVEYREKTASSGKFPGGFLKREGRPSEKEILSSRLIDRPIRPLFPKGWYYETQILATVFSFDPEVDPDTLGALGASAALMISDIPFAGPIAEVRIGRVEGEYVLNPSFELLEKSEMDITVAGSDESIVMVEGEFDEVSEEVFLGALDFAHVHIRTLNNLQRELVTMASQEKVEVEVTEIPEEIVDFVTNLISDDVDEYIHKPTSKKERSKIRRDLKEKVVEAVAEEFAEKEEFEEVPVEKYAKTVLEDIEKDKMRKMIIEEQVRLDGRKLDEIRDIKCEVGILPRTHGSALFTRGETQSLSTATLGTSRDEQMIDGLLPTYTERFILHYNFPPFSTGEVKRLGVGRREIGHGHLAWRALKGMLPGNGDFPYSIRVVSDILESNGSSSMATVCAGSLSMFDAGIPMKKPVAGIAMGLIKEGEGVAILSDILGDEDHLGDMDFKVTGTVDGITACQMDIKIDGLSVDIMTKALNQAKAGRLHILGKMAEAIEAPREDLSNYAPRFTRMTVDQDQIGAVIGPGGETIRAICKDTETDINIDDDGVITIAATSGDAAEKAKEWIEAITAKPEIGKVYEGKVKEIREGLGALVEFMPGKVGLLHISQIARERVEDVAEYLNAGDTIEIKLLDITRDGKFKLSRKVLLPKPEGWVESDDYDRRPPRRDNNRYNDRDRDRGGRRDNYRKPGGDRDRRPPRRDNRNR